MPSIEFIRPTNEDDLAHYPAPGEIFHMLANYGQHVMEIYVPITDDSVWVAPICDAESAMKTKGKIHRHQHVTAEDAVAEGVDPTDADFQALAVNNTLLSPLGVCMTALYIYVMPRAVALMARCYVPKPEVDIDVAYEKLLEEENGKNK